MRFLESVLGKDNKFWKYPVCVIVAFLAANTVWTLPLLIVV